MVKLKRDERSIPKFCREVCEGKSCSKNNSEQQRAARALMRETKGYEDSPLPNCCVCYENGKNACHYAQQH